MLTDFENSFADRLSGKFATKIYLNISPYLKYIATLPLKYICSNNGYAQEVIEANCHVKLSQTKKLFQYICLVKYSLFHSLTK